MSILKPGSIQKRSAYQLAPASPGAWPVNMVHGSSCSAYQTTIRVQRRFTVASLNAVPRPIHPVSGRETKVRAGRRRPPPAQKAVFLGYLMYGCQPSGRGRGQAPGAYLFPQFRTGQAPAAQHNHLHLLRGRRLQQFDDRVHPCARLVGMNPPKRQVFVDSFSFEEPNRRGTHKKSTTPSSATTKKPKANRKKAMPQPAAQPRKPKPKKEKSRKAPTPKRTPEEKREARRLYERARNQQPERKEAARLHAKKIRKERKENGQCRSGSNEAIPGQTRCESCRDKHNRSR